MTFSRRMAIVVVAIGALLFAQPLWYNAMWLGDQIVQSFQYAEGYAQEPDRRQSDSGVSVDIGPDRDQEEEFDLSIRFKNDDAQLKFEGDEDGGSLAIRASGDTWDKWREKAVGFLRSLGFDVSVTR